MSHSSESSSSDCDRGWSSTSPHGEETGSSDRLGKWDRFLRSCGLELYGVSTDEWPSVAKEPPREGMDSMETVLVEKALPGPLSLAKDMGSYSSSSSGGERSKSSGLCPNVKLSCFSETCCRSIMASKVKV